MRQRAAKLTTA